MIINQNSDSQIKYPSTMKILPPPPYPLRRPQGKVSYLNNALGADCNYDLGTPKDFQDCLNPLIIHCYIRERVYKAFYKSFGDSEVPRVYIL